MIEVFFVILVLICIFYLFSVFSKFSNDIFSSRGGSSFTDVKPKYLRNSFVVPKRIGFPGVSSRPFSHTNFFSTSLFTACSEFTPRIYSICDFVIGCLYAIIARVSSSACVSPCFCGDLYICRI